MKSTKKQNISFIGFGEAAMTFVKGWGEAGGSNLKAYDIKTDSPSKEVRQQKSCDYEQSGVTGCKSLHSALKDAHVIFSLVTADQALIAAKNTASHITPNTLYLDCNSCAPDTKRCAAVLISNTGARYVDVAVMAPVQENLQKVPILMSGPHGDMALPVLESLTMTASLLSAEVGDASSVKMMRSIMIKGMEALMMECLLSARKAGVEEVVINSLENSFPEFSFKEKAAYMLERVTTHGLRRAAEMREVAKTVDQLGLDGDMARATAEWQQKIGELEINPQAKENYEKLTDRILANLEEKEELKQNIKSWPVKFLMG